MTGASPSETAAPDPARARAVAFAVLARALGPDPAWLADPDTAVALRAALTASGDDAARRRLDAFAPASLPDVTQLRGSWVRWFDLGRVAPYEGSNVAASAGGVTPRLADVAAFYRAFGMEVRGDRPDHVVAELEFLALALLAEADAVGRHDAEHAAIVARATRHFLRDHIGAWITAWAARVGAVDELAPWTPFAAAAAELVAGEAHRRNVVPVREAAVLAADAGVADASEAIIACEGEPLDALA